MYKDQLGIHKISITMHKTQVIRSTSQNNHFRITETSD